MKNVFFLFLAMLLMSCAGDNISVYNNVVPRPRSVEALNGAPFDCNGNITIVVDENDARMMKSAVFLADYLEKLVGARPEINGEGKAIVLGLKELSDGKEAYEFVVKEDRVEIRGWYAGIFYGIQTLRKAVAGNDGVLPPVEIKDSPAFGYRGAHLDVSRHFFNVGEVKTYLDMMALHNMNRFHWHISDDQGWRVEIGRYPELTAKGSIRKKTLTGHVHDGTAKFDDRPYGEGFFYTKEQIKEVVEYARDRYIEIIPEIDLPGHMQAALATYPELGCTGGPYEVWTTWGVSDDVLCAGNPKVYEFLDNVFSEIVEMFPFEYVHIGGDECPKVRWQVCPRCQKKIAGLGYVSNEYATAENMLQAYVMSHVADFLKEKGRKSIGWDEVLEGGACGDITVMSWRGESGGIAAAKLGKDVIMTPYTHLYFDYNQCEDFLDREPYGRLGYGVVTLESVYGYEPLPASLSEDEQKHVIGLQANLWTEYVCSFEHVQYQVLPRWAALAENQWAHPAEKNYSEFLERLSSSLLKIYDAEEYNYSSIAYDLL